MANVCFNFILLFSIFSIQANAIPHYIQHVCTTDNNFTDTSFYKTNLNELLPTLTAQSSSDPFYNFTTGSEPNKVYGLYYCRGDVTSQDCNDCVKAAADEIVSICPVAKEAIVWYQECTLRYSNISIFSVEMLAPAWMTWSRSNVSNSGEFVEALFKIVDQLTQQALFNSSYINYAKGKIKVTESQNIYCLVQCTPDLNSTQCERCLKYARTGLPDCCPSGSFYASINVASCRLMYDISPFGPGEVGSTSPPPPPPPPPSPPPSSTNKSSDNSVPSQPSPPPSPSRGKDTKVYALAIGVPVAAAALLLLGVVLFCLRRHRKVEKIVKDDGNEYHIEGATQFDIGAMKSATNNFAPSHKLGEGGFGIVYKGKLQNGQEVAIKRLSHESKQGLKEFINEVQLIVKLQHKNLVRLVGFCTEGEERLLVYEFMPKLSLDHSLFDPSKSKYLAWETRYKILEGIARGIHYLHEDSRLTVVHRDLKASNILLDQDMNPKVADFGIAKHVVVDQTHSNTTKIVGTRGYMAPEYAMAGQFSVKSDVYSFGVMLLEIIRGQSNTKQYQQEQEGFLVHAWRRWTEEDIEELIDPSLRNTVSRMEVGRCIQIALLCVQYDPASRPTMHTVLLMLNSRSMELPSPSSPSPMVHGVSMDIFTEYRQQTGSEISTGTQNMDTDMYPR